MVGPRTPAHRTAIYSPQKQYPPITSSTVSHPGSIGLQAHVRQPRFFGTPTQQIATPKTWFQRLKEKWYTRPALMQQKRPLHMFEQEPMPKPHSIKASQYADEVQKIVDDVEDIKIKFEMNYPVLASTLAFFKEKNAQPIKESSDIREDMMAKLERARKMLQAMQYITRAVKVTAYVGGYTLGQPMGIARATAKSFSLKPTIAEVIINMKLDQINQLYNEIAEQKKLDGDNEVENIEESLEQLD